MTAIRITHSGVHPEPVAGLDLNLRYLVIGLGVTGLSVVRYLSDLGAQVAVADTRDAPPGLETLRELYPDVAVFTGEFSADVADHADCLVVSPGISIQRGPIAEIARRGKQLLGDVELFARAAAKPVVAITGTNGKSTVTTLVGDMAREAGLRVKVGGNLGAPVLDLLDDAETDIYVLELSSFQLETTGSLKPKAATVLNLSPDHMDRYDSYEDYIAAKARIYADGTVKVANRDDRTAYALGADNSFGCDAPEANEWGVRDDDLGRRWIARGDARVFPVDEMKVPGEHNVVNAMASMALAEAVHIPTEAMARALRAFTGLEHRTEWIGEYLGVRWFNDSKGTNVGATIAAIEGMPGPMILIVGGDGKGADFSPLVSALGDSIKGVILMGRDAPLIGELIGNRVETRASTSLRETVEIAKSWAVRGDTVLFSPACASFDMFENYARRGELFKEMVREVCA